MQYRRGHGDNDKLKTRSDEPCRRIVHMCDAGSLSARLAHTDSMSGTGVSEGNRLSALVRRTLGRKRSGSTPHVDVKHINETIDSAVDGSSITASVTSLLVYHYVRFARF